MAIGARPSAKARPARSQAIALVAEVEGVEDFDSDSDADILWRHTDGRVVMWEMEDGAYVINHNFGVVANTWQIKGTGEF